MIIIFWWCKILPFVNGYIGKNNYSHGLDVNYPLSNVSPYAPVDYHNPLLFDSYDVNGWNYGSPYGNTHHSTSNLPLTHLDWGDSRVHYNQEHVFNNYGNTCY